MLAAGLELGLRQRAQEDGVGHQLARFGQRLQERQVAVVAAAAQELAGLELADVGDQLVHQHHARRVGREQRREHVLARRGAGGVGRLDGRERFLAAELPGELAPQGADAGRAVLPGLSGGVGVAVEDRDPRLRHVEQPGLVEQGRDAGEVAQGAAAGGEVVDGEQGVGLAAAEGGLQLDHRLAARAVQALRHLDEQQAHALGDEGALEEGGGVLVLARRLAGAHGGDVGGELRLQEGAFEHVGMGNGDLSPRLHGLSLQFVLGPPIS